MPQYLPGLNGLNHFSVIISSLSLIKNVRLHLSKFLSLFIISAHFENHNKSEWEIGFY